MEAERKGGKVRDRVGKRDGAGLGVKVSGLVKGIAHGRVG